MSEVNFSTELINEKFSYSKLETFENCGFKFKLKYRDKLNFFTENIATSLGTCIHAAEETIANNIKANIPTNYVELKNSILVKMYELQHKFPAAFEELDKSGRTYKQKIYEYLETGIYRLEKYLKANPTYEVVATEQYFNFEFEGVKFQGYIDRILKDTATNKYIVHDVKTYAIPVEDKKLTTPLQFVIYVLALNKLYGVELDQVSCAYDLPFCDIIQPAGTKGFMDRGIKKLTKLLTSVSEKDFAPSPSPLCHWCEFCPTNPNQPKETKGKVLCPYHSLYTKIKPSFEVVEKWQGLDKHEVVLESYVNKIILQTV